MDIELRLFCHTSMHKYVVSPKNTLNWFVHQIPASGVQ